MEVSGVGASIRASWTVDPAFLFGSLVKAGPAPNKQRQTSRAKQKRASVVETLASQPVRRLWTSRRQTYAVRAHTGQASARGSR
jgi:hypothetical protein